jgi:hypothetical protein
MCPIEAHLEAFMRRTCGGRAVQVIAVGETGPTIRICCVDTSEDASGNRTPATVVEILVPWEAIEDAENGDLRGISEYIGADVRAIEHYGMPESPGPNGASLVLCGFAAQPDKLFKAAVSYALSIDQSLDRER